METKPAKSMATKTTVNAVAQGSENLLTYMVLMMIPTIDPRNQTELSGAQWESG